MNAIDKSFWSFPPWGNGEKKYRLGLRPIEEKDWLNRKPDNELLLYKKELLDNSYNKVVATTEDSALAQEFLGKLFGVTCSQYPDLIAELSLNIQDDLCIMESNNKQRLLAASICSPSYWDVKTKIGKSLKEIHKPVSSLEEKIGERISKFIKQAPVLKPFARQNWLIHGDTKRFHLEEEDKLQSNPSKWFIRSEKETLCRFHDEYSLFTINVLFQPLKLIHQYPAQKQALIKSLSSFDNDESIYFGGEDKINILLEYLEA
tara:strand:+ start:569 stop:1351 length:783 start_codon:yes stop_codon:yes gene_type:complete